MEGRELGIALVALEHEADAVAAAVADDLVDAARLARHARVDVALVALHDVRVVPANGIRGGGQRRR